MDRCICPGANRATFSVSVGGAQTNSSGFHRLPSACTRPYVLVSPCLDVCLRSGSFDIEGVHEEETTSDKEIRFGRRIGGASVVSQRAPLSTSSVIYNQLATLNNVTLKGSLTENADHISIDTTRWVLIGPYTNIITACAYFS